ncbi:2-hydroxyhepta-2,4-diene-1,7-dioate isomerase [Kribbella sp. ALI-6-A]|uniref:fumarylacetoacetate hydrolase family protein n=1 Tax=Kribbella sp. ALI-6-A TaxID=1933817 RepID=UPI00097BE0D1|nr:fumarylacetoacetate hydrolase family protein [Kribbella sp. ALI-6-A]ONI79090.1 2-hydroxyhepta-2,4-diene-1,7-dioate isomerase [Kribbella sp. ALI-6-A]
MKLATVRIDRDITRAVRLEGESLVDLGLADVDEVLRQPNWQEAAHSKNHGRYPLAQAEFAPLVSRPGKIICVGLNYRTHILEMGREIPSYPTLFSKYREALIGASDPILLPPESDAVDWEAELAVVVGAATRRATTAEASAAIAGFAVLNDVTMRDWQYRTPMWLQGKTWESSTPFGPYLVTPDELPGGVRPALDISCEVNGQIVQKTNTSDLVFPPVALIEYISTIVTLEPGDVIATGTPGGVGHARKPPVYLRAGDILTTRIAGLGHAVNPTIAEAGRS